MKRKRNAWIMGAAGVLVAGAAATGAQAAPLARTFEPASAAASPLIEAAYRQCWTQHGKRHCTLHYGPQVYGYSNRYGGGGDYYEHDSNALPFGSQRWWDQMLRENRLNPGGGRN